MENDYHYIETLKDMYLLLERCRVLAEDMHDKTPTKHGYILECCGCIDFLCECTQSKLFNCAGALHLDLAKWVSDFNKQRKGVK